MDVEVTAESKVNGGIEGKESRGASGAWIAGKEGLGIG